MFHRLLSGMACISESAHYCSTYKKAGSRTDDIFTLSIKSNRMVGYCIEIIDILYPDNGV